MKFQIYNVAVIKDHEEYEFLKSIMITEPEAILLVQYGHMRDIEVFFTPMYDCIDWLDTIGINYYKIRYADRYNLKLLEKIEETNKLKFISWNWEFAPNELKEKGYNILLCEPKYPAELKRYLGDWYIYGHGYDGFSDHTSNLTLLQVARDFEVEYFEKHVKLDDDCIESAWSVTFESLKKILMESD